MPAAAATVPPDVPELPMALQPRPELLTRLRKQVLGEADGRSRLAITAAQGMGGVGKTTAAAQLVRDPQVSALHGIA